MLLFLCVRIPAGGRIRESFPPVRGSRFVRKHGFDEIIWLHRCTFSSGVPRICIFCTSGVFLFGGRVVLVAGEIVSFWGFFCIGSLLALFRYSILCSFWRKILKDDLVVILSLLSASIAQLVEREAVNLKVGRSKLP